MAAYFSRFLPKVDRKLSYGFVVTASVATFFVQFAPHTFCIDKYRDIVAMYQDANPVPLAEQVRKRWNQALKDLSLPEHEARYLKPFTVFGFDLFTAGTITSKWGAIVGIPINFTYTDVSTIDATPIRVNNESVNWNRADAKQLLEALVLSEDAQLYGIAREILMVRHNRPAILAFIGSFMVSSTYILCKGANVRFDLLNRPMPIRVLFYFAGCLFSYGIWATQKDILTTMWEKDADVHIAQLDKRYSTGAVEFYNKMLKRNMALRSLLGAQGETVYTALGNEMHFFRQPSIPIDTRKEFFEKQIAAVNQEPKSFIEGEAIPAPA